MSAADLMTRARAGEDQAFDQLTEPYRREAPGPLLPDARIVSGC